VDAVAESIRSLGDRILIVGVGLCTALLLLASLLAVLVLHLRAVNVRLLARLDASDRFVSREHRALRQRLAADEAALATEARLRERDRIGGELGRRSTMPPPA
jgi:signal transduction histidine kinase